MNNEVYDAGPSCEALALYNAIARFANNDTSEAYFSGKRWKKHHRVGHAKLAEAMRWLLEKKLIAPTGKKTDIGAAYFELLSTNHLKGCSTVEQGGVPPQNRGVSHGRTGGVPPQNTNKTITRQSNKTRKPSGAPSALRRRLTDTCGEAHKYLTGQKLEWIGHEKAYGEAMKKIDKMLHAVEGLPDTDDARHQYFRQKCAAYVEQAQNDAFLKKHGVTPLSLLNNWNKVHYTKAPRGSGFDAAPKVDFPPYLKMSAEEITAALDGWQDKFSALQVKQNISRESWDEYTGKNRSFAKGLAEILIREMEAKRENIKRSA